MIDLNLLKLPLVFILFYFILYFIFSIDQRIHYIFLPPRVKKKIRHKIYFSFLLKSLVGRKTNILNNIIFSLIMVPFAFIPFCSPFFIQNKKYYSEILHSDFGLLFLVMSIIIINFWKSIAEFYSNSSLFNLKISFYTTMFVNIILLMLISLCSIMFLYRGFNIHDIVKKQEYIIENIVPAWGIFKKPVSALIFLVAIYFNLKAPVFLYDKQLINLDSKYNKSDRLLNIFLPYVVTVLLVIIFSIVYLGGYSIYPIKFSGDLIFFSKFLELIIFVIKVLLTMFLAFWFKHIFIEFKHDNVVHFVWKYILPIGVLDLLLNVRWVIN